MNGLRGATPTPEDVMANLIADLVMNRKEEVISLLRKSGLSVSKSSSNDEIIYAVYAAFQKVPTFRSDLYALSSDRLGEMSYVGDDFFSYVGDDDFFNFGIPPTTLNEIGTSVKSSQTTTKSRNTNLRSQGGQGTAVGNFIRSVFTPERKEQLLNTGFDVLTKKLTQKADTAQAQQLIDLESAKAQAALAEAERNKTQASSKKWVVPVVIGGLVVVGVIVYLVMRKK